MKQQNNISSTKDLLLMKEYCKVAHDYNGQPIVSLCGSWGVTKEISNCPWSNACDLLLEVDTVLLPCMWRTTKEELCRILRLFLIQMIES